MFRFNFFSKKNILIYRSKFENEKSISIILLKDFIKSFSKSFIFNVSISKKEFFSKKRDLRRKIKRR